MTSLPEGTYVVTGGAGAIGAATVQRLHEVGAERVVVADLSRERATEVAEAVGDGVEAAPLDLGDPLSIDRFIEQMQRTGRPLAGLVNAAGVFGRSTFPDVGWKEWMTSLSVNLVGPYRLTTGLRSSLQAGAGVVNVTSVEAFHVLSTGGATTPQYASSKGGLQMLTHTLAADLAPLGIRVNAVAPGYIATPINQEILDDAARRAVIEERIPLGWRTGSPEEVAGPIAFLLSREAGYMTGQTLTVDGGLTLGTVCRKEGA